MILVDAKRQGSSTYRADVRIESYGALDCPCVIWSFEGSTRRSVMALLWKCQENLLEPKELNICTAGLMDNLAVEAPERGEDLEVTAVMLRGPRRQASQDVKVAHEFLDPCDAILTSVFALRERSFIRRWIWKGLSVSEWRR